MADISAISNIAMFIPSESSGIECSKNSRVSLDVLSIHHIAFPIVLDGQEWARGIGGVRLLE